jgi:hypothetical protein
MRRPAAPIVYYPSMDLKVGKCSETWREVTIGSVGELHRYSAELSDGKQVAWRGQARPEWMLESTLDRILHKVAPDKPYTEWLGRERKMIERFRSRAERYASETEKQYLQGSNLTTLAFGRHAGLPTRLLD